MVTFITAAVLGAYASTPGPDIRVVAGWHVEVSQRLAKENPKELATALTLLEGQLKEVARVVPEPALTKLRKVKLFFSPPYSDSVQGAAYHPGAQWLKDNDRDPRMAGCIEFYNIPTFVQEARRMPNFALHELAHAYHHQFLPQGFENPSLKKAYQEAKESGIYDSVERQDSEGRRTKDRAYAISNHMEYFAALSEAFFSKNDFFPFHWAELIWHDPKGSEALRLAWGVSEVSRPPASVTTNSFYGKFFDAGGFPILSSSKVRDYALKEAGFLVSQVLSQRPDIKRAMALGGSRMVVMAWNELTTQVPEHSWLTPKEFWDRRARGLGGSETDPVCSCGEENLLSFPGDPYSTESITIHEFAHSIHLRGLKAVDPTFDGRLRAAYDAATKKGLWKETYAATNHAEYWAEGVQSWFDTNREQDSSHNHVNTREEIKAYDPALSALLKEVLGDGPWRHSKATTRLTGHLAGYDPSKAPTFVWPKGS